MHLILSVDGGGTRGVIPAQVLHRLAIEVATWGRRLHDSLDHCAGTSTGALVAAGIACGMDAHEMVDLYVTKAARIFKDSVWDQIHDLGVLKGAQYDSEPLREVLLEVFGERTLGDIEKRVLFPTVGFDRFVQVNGGIARTIAMKYCHNWPESKDRSLPLVEVLRWSAAAPIYFPLVVGEIIDDGQPRRMPFADGGLCNNNPADSAIAQALSKGIPREEIYCLSLGTGTNLFRIEAPAGKDTIDMGALDWIKGGKLIHAMMDPGTGASDFRARAMLPDGHYHRVQTILAEETPLDSVAAIPKLIEVADAIDLRPTTSWLRDVCTGAAV